MTFHSLRNSLVSGALALVASLLVASCGGGGASVSPVEGGVLQVVPPNQTVYAGIPATVTIVGGRKPYAIGVSEPNLVNAPQILNGNSFDFIPNNPGIVDPNLQPNELPRRTVTITVRDAVGQTTTGTIVVGQNFLSTYGAVFTPTTCGELEVGAVACAGGQTAVQFNSTFNGNLHGGEQFRLDVIRGNYSLRQPQTGQVSNSIVVTSDEGGNLNAIIEVPAGVPTQIGVIRITHVQTGAYIEQVFVIDGSAAPTTLTAIPEEVTFTGALSTVCGTGAADIFVFDGVPPYTALSSNASITVTPTTSTTNPGRFTILASNSSVCVDAAPVIITDSLGGRTTVEVTTERGDVDPPTPTPLTVEPDAITLACGTSGAVSVVGGSGTYSVSSTHPRVTAVVSGRRITITRTAGDGATVYPTDATVTVTDGNSIDSVDVAVPANCP